MATVAEDTGILKVTYEDGVVKEWTGTKRKLYKDYGITKDGKLWQKFYLRREKDNYRYYEYDPSMAMLDEEHAEAGLNLGQVAAGHGLGQKFGDELASLGGDLDDYVEALDSMDSRIRGGKWFAERTGGQPGQGILYKALLELKQKQVPGITEADARTAVQAFMSKKNADEKEALKRNGPPALMEIIRRLEAEKAAAAPQIDTEKLMVGL